MSTLTKIIKQLEKKSHSLYHGMLNQENTMTRLTCPMMRLVKNKKIKSI